jgi:hypothetical protein
VSGIRARLLLLVGLAIVPLFAFTLYQGLAERRRAADRERSDARRLVQLFAAEHRRVVSDARRLLFVLSQGPTVRQANPDACAQLFGDVMSASPEYANLLLAGPGEAVIASVRPGMLDADDRELVARAVHSKFAVGPIRLRASSPIPAFNVAHSVAGHGNTPNVLLARVGMRWIADEFAVAGLGARTRVSLWDGTGRVLLRYPDPERLLGRDASASEVWRAIGGTRGEGTAEAAGADGVRRLYGFTRLCQIYHWQRHD